MEQNNIHDEIEIDLKELFFVLLRRIWIIILAGVGAGTLGFLASHFLLTPQYQTTTQVYILNKQAAATVTYQDLQSSTQLTKDYMKLVKARPVLESVISTLDLDMKYDDLASKISVSNPSDTRLLDITVEYSDPYMAKAIADSVRDISSKHIQDVMQIEQVNKSEDAYVPESPSSPNKLRNSILATLLGAFLAAIVITILYIMDDTLKTPDDIEKYLEVSVLSSIPIQSTGKNDKRKGKAAKNTKARGKKK